MRMDLEDHLDLADDLAHMDEPARAIARIEAHLMRPLDIEISRGNDARCERLQLMAIQRVLLGDTDVGVIDEHAPTLDTDPVASDADNAFEEALSLPEVHQLSSIEAIDDEVTARECRRRIEPDHGVGKAASPIEEEVVLRDRPGEQQRQVDVPPPTKVRPKRSLVRGSALEPPV